MSDSQYFTEAGRNRGDRELNVSIEELLFVIKGGRTLLFSQRMNSFYYTEIISVFFCFSITIFVYKMV